MKPYSDKRLLRDRECNDHGKHCGIFADLARWLRKKANRQKQKADKAAARRQGKRWAVYED